MVICEYDHGVLPASRDAVACLLNYDFVGDIEIVINVFGAIHNILGYVIGVELNCMAVSFSFCSMPVC